jgi:hypothetical protein
MTAPPYEWPTRMIGPEMVVRKSRTEAASPLSVRRWLGIARTG